MENKIPTHELKRELPSWAKVVKTLNTINIYNMDIFDNIMSWTKNIPNVPALDYYGNIITFSQLPEKVRQYVNGLKSIGIGNDDVVTICLPVTMENILSLFAVNKMKKIINSPNFLFLRNDFKTYTEDKGSKTLIILDAYLPFVVDDLQKCGIKNVIIVSLEDCLPENQKGKFLNITNLPSKLQEIFCNVQKQKDCMKKICKLHNINFIKMHEVVYLGSKITDELPTGPVNIDRDVSYSYTSGTTGNPKCIVYKEMSANALLELHEGVNTKDYVGERVFEVIPLTHATGERFCCYLQLGRGKTIVPIPIYNKDSFGEDLKETGCNWITAAPSFYLAGVAHGKISDDAFAKITRPSSGGEPVTKSNAVLINKWLHENGCPEDIKFSIGGGAAEDGSSTICSYFVDESTRTNETGHPVEPGIKAKIVDEKGNIVPKGTRGFLHISSPAAADRYLNNEEATAKRWYYDENGIRWGNTGDIAVVNPNGSYNILGRASDSCIGQDGKLIYLFDIEYSLEVDDPVIEWEITAHLDIYGKSHIVGQVVIKPEYYGQEDWVIKYLCEKYNLEAVKIYDEFESSEVTGKRDFSKLKNDKSDYYAPYDDESLKKIDYNNGIIISQIVPKNIINRKIKIKKIK